METIILDKAPAVPSTSPSQTIYLSNPHGLPDEKLREFLDSNYGGKIIALEGIIFTSYSKEKNRLTLKVEGEDLHITPGRDVIFVCMSLEAAYLKFLLQDTFSPVYVCHYSREVFWLQEITNCSLSIGSVAEI